jgi:hypothetical protein
MDAEANFRLIGYRPCAGHGFAMPLYGAYERANLLFLAVRAATGGAAGMIAAFEPVDVDDRCYLPAGESIEVAVGEPWRDIFLWNDAVFVGTPGQIWAELATFYSDLEIRAPLSMLNLALQAGRVESESIAPVAMGFLTERFGPVQARGWRRQFLRQQLELALRRLLADTPLDDDSFRSVTLSEADEGILVELPRAISGALQPSAEVRQALEALEVLAAGLGAHLLSLPGVIGDAQPGNPQAAPVAPGPAGQDAGNAIPAAAGSAADILPEANRPVTILHSGRRARSVAGHLRPAYSTVVEFDEYDLRILAHENEMFEEDREPQETVILVIDDESLLNGDLPVDLKRVLARHAKRGSLVLIAPALPNMAPSALFDEFAETFLADEATVAHAIIDTAMARSPFWWGSAKRSFNRRISDIVELALTAGRNPALRRELMERGMPGKTPILALGLLPDRSSKDFFVRDAGEVWLGSESSWVDGSPKRNDPDILFSIRMSADGRINDPLDDLLIAEGRARGSRFPEFAAQVLAPLAARKSPRSRHYRMHVEQREELPSDLIRYLLAPRHAAGFELESERNSGPGPLRLVVTAETPTLDLVESGERIGWPVVRYTDTATLRRMVDDGPGPPTFPDEIDLGELRAAELNRRLATRGVDQRDVFRVPAGLVSEWLAGLPRDERADAGNAGRMRRSAARSFGDSEQDWLFPADFLLGDDPAAKRLLELVAGSVRVFGRRQQRLADVHKCWTPPADGLSRYAIVDGAVPVILVELGDHEVPVEDMFVIDGDFAVPVLFRSRVFGVWARATLPAASSWMARFSLGNTFGGFPVVAPFRIDPDTLCRTVLRFEHEDASIESFELEVSRHIERVQSSQSRSGWKEAHRAADDLPAMRRLDEFVLKAYGLPGDADDIMIMRRLMELNAQLR